MRNYRLSTLMAMTCIILLLSFANGKTGEVPADPAEYELMSMLINDEYESEFELILINSETESWCLGGQLGILQKTWPKLKGETIDALIVNNRGRTHRLEKQFRIPVKYRLIPEKEYIRVLNEGSVLNAGTGTGKLASMKTGGVPDWDNFDKAFPDAQGYMTFSKVGFDQDRTQALVIFSNAYRCSGSSIKPLKRKIAYFRNTEGGWQLVGISRGIDTIN